MANKLELVSLGGICHYNWQNVLCYKIIALYRLEHTTVFCQYSEISLHLFILTVKVTGLGKEVYA